MCLQSSPWGGCLLVIISQGSLTSSTKSHVSADGDEPSKHSILKYYFWTSAHTAIIGSLLSSYYYCRLLSHYFLVFKMYYHYTCVFPWCVLVCVCVWGGRVCSIQVHVEATCLLCRVGSFLPFHEFQRLNSDLQACAVSTLTWWALLTTRYTQF